MRYLVLVSTLCLSQPATQVALPADLEVSFNQKVAEIIRLLPPDGEGELEGFVTFENRGAASSVTIDWLYTFDPDEIPADVTQILDVSFKPTAVCRRSGSEPVLYVAGWMERPGSVVVEKWALVGEIALVQTVAPDGTIIATMTAPRIRREQVLFSDELEPLTALAYTPFGEALVMLEAAPAHGLHRLADGDDEPVLYEELLAVSLPDLSSYRTCATAWSPDQGFVVAFFEHPADGAPWDYDTDSVFVMTDADSDGVFDTFEELTNAEYVASSQGGQWTDDF